MIAKNDFVLWFVVFAVVFNSFTIGFLTHDLLNNEEGVVFVEDDLAKTMVSECGLIEDGQCLDTGSRWFGCDVFSRQCVSYCKDLNN